MLNKNKKEFQFQHLLFKKSTTPHKTFGNDRIINVETTEQ